MLQEVSGVIGKIFDTITTVPIENKTFRCFVWALKIISQIVEIVLGGVILGKDIAPNLQKIREGSTDHFEDASSYENAAIAFIVFFALEMTLDIMFWTYVAWTVGQDASVLVSVLLSIFFDMPIIMCGVNLMRYKFKGTIDWDQQMFELIFQIWFILNIMLQITAGYAKKVRYWGVFILGPLSYLIACIPYAFVTLRMCGWYIFPLLSNYHESRHNFIHGTFNSTLTQNMFDFLILSGFIGQWIWMILPIIIAFGILLAFGISVYIIDGVVIRWKIKFVTFICIIIMLISIFRNSIFKVVPLSFVLVGAVGLFICLITHENIVTRDHTTISIILMIKKSSTFRLISRKYEKITHVEITNLHRGDFV